jgi:hypothetical protein
LGLSPTGLIAILYCLTFETPPTRSGRFLYLLSQEQSNPVQLPDIEYD